MYRSKKKISAITSIVVVLLALAAWLIEQCVPIFQTVKAEELQPVQTTNAVHVQTAQTESSTTEQSFSVGMPVLHNGQKEQVISHLAYTVSYNADWHLPNWVAYELTNNEADGAEERSNHFVPDPDVKGDPVVTKDYSNSGYDRGHMAPAADMRWSEQAMRESFYMTNICPQNHNNNAGDWKSLEEMARDWAVKYGSLYIAAGPIVSKHPKTIGTTRLISVPDAFYKVFLRRKNDGKWTAIGFIMDNKAGSKPLMTYMISVDSVESRTGIDFFTSFSESEASTFESQYEVADWTL